MIELSSFLQISKYVFLNYFEALHDHSIFETLCTCPYLPLDVFQHVFMPLEEVQMLELCVVSLRLHQTALLNVHHLTETI